MNFLFYSINLFLFLLIHCDTVILAQEVQNPLDKLEDSDEQSFERDPKPYKGDDSEDPWTVYEPEDFDKNELCSVLSCKKREMCLVRNNNAICSKPEKLDEIGGEKIFYTSASRRRDQSESGILSRAETKKIDAERGYEKNVVDEQEWDQQKVREKMIKFVSKLRNKHKNKLQEISANEVHPNENEESQHRPMTPLSGHERHSPKMGAYQNCTDKELSSIKGRLSKWFSDIHAIQKSEQGYILPRHDYFCSEDVGFMFSTLDGDKDGKLSVDELFSLDNDPYEKCIKIFLDRCDIDHDDFLSINEWCDCFQWSDDERHEPECHAALRKHDPHDPDSFFPNCDLEGYYKMEQCHGDYCWCVDKWGREFDQSRTKGPANCSSSN